MLRFFENTPEILAVMSEREDGNMKLISGGENSENRNKFFGKSGINAEKVFSADLQNGTNVVIVSADSQKIISGADALVINNKNISLSVTIADCIPVYFYEPGKKIIALAHCGWRGIVGGIVRNTLDKILDLGGKVENTKIALGPGINKCHFEIKKDVLDKFSNYPDFIERRENKIFVDLKGIIKKQLDDFRIKDENVENNQECTFESIDKYFSYRRDKPEKIEAMVAVIGLREWGGRRWRGKSVLGKN